MATRCRYSFIYPRDIITPRLFSTPRASSSSSSSSWKVSRARAHEDEDNRRGSICEKGSNTNGQSGHVYFNYFARYFQYSTRMDVVNWIHLFPFLKIRLRPVLGFRIFLAVTLSPPLPLLVSLFSAISILPVSLRLRLVTRIDPGDRLARYEISNEVTILQHLFLRSNCFLSRNDLIIVDSPLAVSPFFRRSRTFALFDDLIFSFFFSTCV